MCVDLSGKDILSRVANACIQRPSSRGPPSPPLSERSSSRRSAFPPPDLPPPSPRLCAFPFRPYTPSFPCVFSTGPSINRPLSPVSPRLLRRAGGGRPSGAGGLRHDSAWRGAEAAGKAEREGGMASEACAPLVIDIFWRDLVMHSLFFLFFFSSSIKSIGFVFCSASVPSASAPSVAATPTSSTTP